MSGAFRNMAANTHSDHDTLATLRRRFLKELEALFVQLQQALVDHQLEERHLGVALRDEAQQRFDGVRRVGLSAGS